MNIDSLTISEAKAIAKMFGGETADPARAWTKGDERPVIVRSQMAGVQFGYLIGYTGREVHLKDARQMWSWKAAKGGTLLDCATHGVDCSKSKLSGPVSKLIALEASSIIDCTPAAVKSIGGAKWE
jgi:hypothetical protein